MMVINIVLKVVEHRLLASGRALFVISGTDVNNDSTKMPHFFSRSIMT